DVGILWIDLHAAEVERPAAVEYRREVEAAVLRFPQAACGGRDPVHVRVLWIHVDVRDAAGRERRADASEGQTLEDLCGQPILSAGSLVGSKGHEKRDESGKRCEKHPLHM